VEAPTGLASVLTASRIYKKSAPAGTLESQDSRAFRSDDDGLRSTVQKVLLVFPRFTANAFPLPYSAMAAQHQARDFANI